jgi:hypothetical protein
MTVTSVETMDYTQSAISAQTPGEQQMSLWELPKLAWAGVALFTINAVIGIGMFVTPDMQTDVYGHEVHGVYAASSKPSPFTQVVDDTKHKVRLAAKVRPVVIDSTPLIDNQPALVESAAASLDIPRSSRPYQLDMPVRTQPAVYRQNIDPGTNLALPRRTEPALHQSTNDVTPRRTSEREKKFVVIN